MSPGPDTLVQEVDNEEPTGNPSSEAVPVISTDDVGRVIDLSGPTDTEGAIFVGDETSCSKTPSMLWEAETFEKVYDDILPCETLSILISLICQPLEGVALITKLSPPNT